MSTKAQVARLVRPFLEVHPEFELVGRSVVLRPVGHTMRRFFIDRCSIKAYIQPNWQVDAMFYPPPQHIMRVGRDLPRAVGHVDRADTQERLLHEMELAAETILLPTASIGQIPALARSLAIPGFPHREPILVLAALGQFSEAAQALAAELEIRQQSLQVQKAVVQSHKSPSSREAKWHAQLLAGMLDARKTWLQVLSLLKAEDTLSIATLLHSWEAAAVRVHAVEHLWQPSPFPFEVSG